MRKYFLRSFGCQMNSADSELIVGLLVSRGFEQENDVEKADVVIVNTCSVREKAENKAFAVIQEYASIKKKGALLWVIGCMAERVGEELKQKIPKITRVIGATQIEFIEEKIDEYLGHDARLPLGNFTSLPQSIQSQWSSLLPIIRGCNNFCTYCIVPYTRGRERSRDVESIMREIRVMKVQGYREVTLLGQNVNSYLWKNEEKIIDFPGLLELVALEAPEMRIRFTTSHPKDMSDATLEIIAKYDNLCKQIHLPAQSGSSRILKAMNRKYMRETYLERIAAIRRILPEASISTDLFCGFPSETEEDHRETLSLMREVGFDSAFMFKYSERPGTYAAKNLPDNVSEDEKVRRLEEIIALQLELSLMRNKEDIGKTTGVLVEGFSKRSREQLFGRTSQNKVIIFDKGKSRVGDLVNVKITGASAATLFGEI
jgi:tRNA-2-methylthio-N6-dimethylallyladenosine synthase